MPELAIMAAMSSNRVIGLNNKLPWHLPADLERVRQVSVGKTYIMGKQTYLSDDVLLSPSKNIILTTSPTPPLRHPSPVAIQAASFNDAFSHLTTDEQVLIMGGASVYKQALKFAHKMYLTVIHEVFEGDTFFPQWNENEWQLIKKEDFQADAENAYAYSFFAYQRLHY